MNGDVVVERGTVKFFSEEGKYGFVEMPGSQDVFFHIYDGVNFRVGDDGPIRVRPKRSSRNKKPIRAPQVGEELVFEKIRSGKGPKAKWWGYASAYEKASRRKSAVATVST